MPDASELSLGARRTVIPERLGLVRLDAEASSSPEATSLAPEGQAAARLPRSFKGA
jgi:hypothetical protein